MNYYSFQVIFNPWKSVRMAILSKHKKFYETLEMNYYSFQVIFNPWKSIRMTMLSKHNHGRSRVADSTREISGLCSLLVRVAGKLMRTLIWGWVRKLRVDKWSIIGWEGWEWIKRYSKLIGGSPRLCWLRTTSCWATWNKHWIVLTHVEFMGPINLVASVTSWWNRNRYSKIVVGGRMR
jgi:hypothetical protein